MWNFTRRQSFCDTRRRFNKKTCAHHETKYRVFFVSFTRFDENPENNACCLLPPRRVSPTIVLCRNCTHRHTINCYQTIAQRIECTRAHSRSYYGAGFGGTQPIAIRLVSSMCVCNYGISRTFFERYLTGGTRVATFRNARWW